MSLDLSAVSIPVVSILRDCLSAGEQQQHCSNHQVAHRSPPSWFCILPQKEPEGRRLNSRFAHRPPLLRASPYFFTSATHCRYCFLVGCGILLARAASMRWRSCRVAWWRRGRSRRERSRWRCRWSGSSKVGLPASLHLLLLHFGRGSMSLATSRVKTLPLSTGGRAVNSIDYRRWRTNWFAARLP
jgi:hypothetical protein